MSGPREQARRVRKTLSTALAELDAFLSESTDPRGRKRLTPPQDVLEAARARIAAGEDPDEVARTTVWYVGNREMRVTRKTLMRRLNGE